MADSAASTLPGPQLARSQKRRAPAVSTETENKLARAARSAQRLAQLSDIPRDDSTLDLFPDDSARATQQAMNIDVRQGTLQGFELPHVVLAAVGAPDGVGFTGPTSALGSTADGKSLRRAARVAAGSKEDAAGEATHDGQMVIETEADADPVAASLAAVDETKDEPNASDRGEELAPKTAAAAQASSMAAASVVRSVAALRQSAEPDDDTPSPLARAGVAPQRFAGALGNAATGSRETGANAAANVSPGTDGTSDTAATAHAARSAPSAPYVAPTQATQANARRATPELDHARATAFADTVDALYGVIADQRRAAGDHSRRMKWMLTIVVCALLMTVAIGIAQTLLLFRLSSDAKTQQQRIEQMMMNQQATLATLLDTDSSTTSLPTVAPPAATPAQPAGPASAAPAAGVPPKPAEAHADRSQHGHRRKLAHTH
jgi:hypothetical protein